MAEAPQNDATSADTMRYWLARTLRQTRESRGVSRDAIRMLVPGRDGNPMDISTLSRFENGQTWPREIDALVPAYALLCGIEDPRELWKQALADWLAKGAAPTVGQLSPALRSVMLAVEARQRQQPYDAESQGKPTSIPKKTAEPRSRRRAR